MDQVKRTWCALKHLTSSLNYESYLSRIAASESAVGAGAGVADSRSEGQQRRNPLQAMQEPSSSRLLSVASPNSVVSAGAGVANDADTQPPVALLMQFAWEAFELRKPLADGLFRMLIGFSSRFLERLQSLYSAVCSLSTVLVVQCTRARKVL